MTRELILMFEDYPPTRNFFTLALNRKGYLVQAYSSPNDLFSQEDHLARLAESALVYADHLMPEMNGRELVQKLRADHSYEKPIIINSSMDEYDVRRLYPATIVQPGGKQVAAVNMFLQKPVFHTALLGAIVQQLSKKA